MTNDVSREMQRRYRLIRGNKDYRNELPKMDTALEKITLGLKVIYGSYDKIPASAMNLSKLGESRNMDKVSTKDEPIKMADMGFKGSKMIDESIKETVDWDNSSW